MQSQVACENVKCLHESRDSVTFSIVFHDKDSRTWGVGVASKFISVGSVVPWAKAGVGAVATQSFSNYSYGPRGLEMLESRDAKSTLEALVSQDEKKEWRQAAIVDRNGNVAAHTGKECMDFAGHIMGDGFSVQGNILAGEKVIEAMAGEMEKDTPILEKILRTLEAGDSQGGDRRGRQSAAILIATEGKPFEEFSDRFVDLRVDDSLEPFKEMRRMALLWEATFFDQEMVNISDYEDEIASAIRKSGYKTVKEWADNNNFTDKIAYGKIGSKVLEALISGARDQW